MWKKNVAAIFQLHSTLSPKHSVFSSQFFILLLRALMIFRVIKIQFSYSFIIFCCAALCAMLVDVRMLLDFNSIYNSFTLPLNECVVKMWKIFVESSTMHTFIEHKRAPLIIICYVFKTVFLYEDRFILLIRYKMIFHCRWLVENLARPLNQEWERP